MFHFSFSTPTRSRLPLKMVSRHINPNNSIAHSTSRKTFFLSYIPAGLLKCSRMSADSSRLPIEREC